MRDIEVPLSWAMLSDIRLTDCGGGTASPRAQAASEGNQVLAEGDNASTDMLPDPILVQADRLRTFDAYRETVAAVTTIRYTQELDTSELGTPELASAAASEFVFWGPYVALPAGVYLIAIEGRLEGELILDFTSEAGSVQLKRITMTDFSDPICLVLLDPVNDLEMRGAKTPALASLNIEAISFQCTYIADEVAAKAFFGL